jgi:DNA-binding transcriptional ArsR family regulator
MDTLPRTFAALSDPTRFALVEHLLTGGESPAGDLVARTSISAPAVSRHLKVLREAGVLRQRVNGTQRLYSVNPAALAAIDDWTARHRAMWQSALDRLAAAIERTED